MSEKKKITIEENIVLLNKAVKSLYKDTTDIATALDLLYKSTQSFYKEMKKQFDEFTEILAELKEESHTHD